ncbi:serine/threonine protein kinase, partial [Streptomyces sp. NPDC057654]
AEEYAEQHTERRPGGGTPAPRPQQPRAAESVRASAPRTGGSGRTTNGGRTGSGRTTNGGRTGSGRGTAGRSGSRPPARTTGTGRRSPGPDRRLLRQRLIVFVVVTLLVALGIAAAQGCQGPAHSMGELHRAPVESAEAGT